MEYIHCDYKNLNFKRGKNKEDFQFPFPVGNYKFHKSSLEIIVFNCPGGGAISPNSQTPPPPLSTPL